MGSARYVAPAHGRPPAKSQAAGGRPSRERTRLNPHVLWVAAVVAVASSVLPYSLNLEALRRIPPRVFGALTSLEPAAGAVFGLAVLRQHLRWPHWLGIAAVASASATAALTNPAKRSRVRATGSPAAETSVFARETVTAIPPRVEPFRLDLGECLPGPTGLDQLSFEQADRGLHQGIVVGVADRTDGRGDACPVEVLGERERCVLRPGDALLYVNPSGLTCSGCCPA
ncbi:EamA family transporter [Streptomyces sp. NPDC001312]|uniref:EamA family transporter n=1 Tax=Streptomyces sp. NPDC001312 TaxID=3364561 RepID=UPI00367F2C1B